MKKIIEAFISLILAVLMVGMIFGAAVQYSFRNSPPTASELASDPALERYVCP